MTTQILDGKIISKEVREELKKDIIELKSSGIIPGLGVLLVGDDPASRSYVTAKEKACEDVGIYSSEIRLPSNASRDEILDVVHQFNGNEKIHGILVQLPLPDGTMEQEVIDTLSPEKDVDGFHPINIGRMALGLSAFLSCTPHGILHMLKRSGLSTNGAHVVVVGRSHIVGRPLATMLSQKNELGNATVTMCHTGTKNLARFTREADIVIAAIGRANTITAEMVSDGVVIIDVGVNRVEDATAKRGYRLVGDVDFEAIKPKAKAISPVPGGVGPMTITMLLYNTVESAKNHLSSGRSLE
ncbi:MAG: bifunctional methylenetetrahydrofolate dehydrogenase/methenyltetrahydrofolate cyclohydrolase FolD [Kiritimatiellae bacterium]|nr:bifunctional methylenetetrahydrofolate dehydrogenase/methenyltetrahydrofolate cyclohydrolase FolD [Kiritimatiellia bacterium]